MADISSERLKYSEMMDLLILNMRVLMMRAHHGAVRALVIFS